MNRQLVREAYFYLVGLALTLCPPLSTFLYVRLSSLSRDDLIPNCSVNTSLRLRASSPPLSKNPSSRDPSSASFDEVFNAAGHQHQGERLDRPPPSPSSSSLCPTPQNAVLQILVRGICGYPPIVSQYQPRIAKGLTPGAMRDGQRGQQRWKTGYGRSYGVEEGGKQRNPFSLSLSLMGRLQFDPQSPPSKYSNDDDGGGGGGGGGGSGGGDGKR